MCCCYSLDNCTNNLSLLPHHYLEVNCLSLKLLVSCLLSHPKPITQQGCLKSLQWLTEYPSSLTKPISVWYYAPCKNFLQELLAVIWWSLKKNLGILFIYLYFFTGILTIKPNLRDGRKTLEQNSTFPTICKTKIG